MVDGRRRGGFSDLECDLGQAITLAIAVLGIVKRIPTLIEQLERYRCSEEDAASDYQIARRNVHYNDAIILINEMLT